MSCVCTAFLIVDLTCHEIDRQMRRQEEEEEMKDVEDVLHQVVIPI